LLFLDFDDLKLEKWWLLLNLEMVKKALS